VRSEVVEGDNKALRFSVEHVLDGIGVDTLGIRG
jgi:hypothetical protein